MLKTRALLMLRMLKSLKELRDCDIKEMPFVRIFTKRKQIDATPTKLEILLLEINLLLTPKTRQKESRLAKDITDDINSMDLSVEDHLDVITLTLKNLNISGAYTVFQ